VIKKLIDVIPYWMAHALVALGIAIVLWLPLGLVTGLTTGIAFYVVREIAQWEANKKFDWPGLLAPLVVNGGVMLFYLWVAPMFAFPMWSI